MITENTTVHVGEINISEADRKYLFDVDQVDWAIIISQLII